MRRLVVCSTRVIRVIRVGSDISICMYELACIESTVATVTIITGATERER